jgi:hypothetical protein
MEYKEYVFSGGHYNNKLEKAEMQHTPPNSNSNRVSAILLSRVIFLTLLANLAPPSANAYKCHTGYNDYGYLGLDTSGNACAAGKWN